MIDFEELTFSGLVLRGWDTASEYVPEDYRFKFYEEYLYDTDYFQITLLTDCNEDGEDVSLSVYLIDSRRGNLLNYFFDTKGWNLNKIRNLANKIVEIVRHPAFTSYFQKEFKKLGGEEIEEY